MVADITIHLSNENVQGLIFSGGMFLGIIYGILFHQVHQNTKRK